MKQTCDLCRTPIKQGFPIRGKFYCTLPDKEGRCIPLRPPKKKNKR